MDSGKEMGKKEEEEKSKKIKGEEKSWKITEEKN